MDNFEIVLKNDRLNSYKQTGYLVAAINFIYFIIYTFYTKQGYEKIVWIALSIAILFFGFFNFLTLKSTALKKYNLTITYSLLIIFWVKISIWMSAIHCLLLIGDILAKRKLLVIVDTGGIVYPSIPKKNIPWDVLSNVILKDGLLTIDLKNNKLLQAEIDTTGNEVDATVFNLFCKRQLNDNN